MLRYVLWRWHRVAGGRAGGVAAGDGRGIATRTDGSGVRIAALIGRWSIAVVASGWVVGLHHHAIARMRGVA